MAYGEAHHLSRSSRPPPSQSHCSWLWCHWMKPRKLVVLWEWTTNHYVPMETQTRGWTVLIGGCCAEGVEIYVVAVETGRKPRPLRAWGRLRTAAAATMDKAQTNESGSTFIKYSSLRGCCCAFETYPDMLCFAFTLRSESTCRVTQVRITEKE